MIDKMELRDDLPHGSRQTAPSPGGGVEASATLPRSLSRQARVALSAILALAASTILALAACAPLAAASTADTYASIAPSLSPNRLHAKAALTFAIQYSGGEFGVPTPLRRAVLRLPAGLSLEVPSLRSCSAADLETRGGRGCPAQSVIGSGHALVEARLGAQTLTEKVTLRAFMGPPRNLQPTFEILADGHRPIGQQVVLTATAQPTHAPYGEELVMSIPPISTFPSEPDASIATFSLTIGLSGPHRPRHAPTVIVPSHCPAGGLPFAAEFTYADGSHGNAFATSPCPR
jgi:hypothetical protein